MELLERESQQRLLDDSLAATSGGKGRIALITGEAGRGKTSPAQDFVSRRPRSKPWHRGFRPGRRSEVRVCSGCRRMARLGSVVTQLLGQPVRRREGASRRKVSHGVRHNGSGCSGRGNVSGDLPGEPDDAFMDLEPQLRDALVIGRPFPSAPVRGAAAPGGP